MDLSQMCDRDPRAEEQKRKWIAISLLQLRHLSESHCASQQFETYSLASLSWPRGSSVPLLPAAGGMAAKLYITFPSLLSIQWKSVHHSVP